MITLFRYISSGSRRSVLALAFALPLVLAGCKSVEERVQDHFDRGMAFVASGEDDKARLEFSNALNLAPEHLPALLEIAALHERAGNLQGTAGHLIRVTDIDPENVEAQMRLARLLSRTGQFDIALPHINRVLKITPHDVEALALRAGITYKLGNVIEGLQDASSALELQPLHPEAGAIIVMDRIQSRDLEAALEINSAFLSANPLDLNLNLLHLQILAGLNRSEAIGPHLILLADRFPDLPRFRIGLAEWHAQAGNIAAAIEQYRAYAAALDDQIGPALELVAFLQRQRGDAIARAELVRLAETRSPAFPFEIALARFDQEAGQGDSARARLEALIARTDNPDDRNNARALLANLYLGLGETDRAEALAEAVLTENADHAQALAIRANLRLRQSKIEEAMIDLRRAVIVDSENPPIYLLLAEAHRLSDNDTLAGENIARAMQVSGYAEPMTLRYVTYLLERGRIAAAETVLSEAARRRPGSREILSRLAEMRLRLGKWAEAEAIASELGRLDAGAGIAARIRAAALSGQNRHSESLSILSSLPDVTNQRGSVLRELVAAYVRAGQPEEAQAVLARILEQNPANLQALSLRAAFHESENRLAEAITDLQAIIAAAPDMPGGYELMADFHQRNGDRGAWEKVIAAGLTRNPGFSGLRLRRAGVLELDGDIPAALREYETLLEQSPDYLIAINNVVSLLSDHYADDPEKLARARQLAPQLAGTPVPQFQDTYGWILYLSGDYDTALRALIPAAEILQDNPWVRYHVGMAFDKVGQPDAAASHLRAALDLAGDGAFAPRDAIQATLAALGN